MHFPLRTASRASRRWLRVLVALGALLFAPPVGAIDDADRDLLFGLLRDLDPGEELDVPGFGKISGDLEMSGDFPLPDRPERVAHQPCCADSIPAGVKLGDLFVDAITYLTNDELEDLFTRFAPPPPSDVPADPTYTIRIESVDTRDFPIVSLRMKIFPKDIATPAFSPTGAGARGVVVLEQILDRSETVTGFLDFPPIQICEVETVAMALAMDTSCSVTSVLGDMREKAALFFERVLDPARAKSPEDAVALWTFDGKGRFRAPAIGSTPEFASITAAPPDFLALARAIEVGPPCSGSPIFSAMEQELLRLARYRAGEAVNRALVTFADFRDTEGAADQRNLIRTANANDVTLVNLGFGRVDVNRVTNVTDGTGGSFIQNASENALQALEMVYDGLAFTYCLRYQSPFPNMVNETNTVTVTLADGSTASARYPMPFVVPEDTPGVQLFLPMSRLAYDRLTASGPPQTSAVVSLLGGSEGPTRRTTFTFDTASTSWAEDPDLGPGFLLTGAGDPASWQELFRVPTQFMRLAPEDPGEPAIQGVSHFRADIHFRTAASAGTGRPYLSTPRISVQDRTPPHLYLQVNLGDGGDLNRLRLYEHPVDADPFPLDPAAPPFAGGRLGMAQVEPRGFGAKRGRLELLWKTVEGFRRPGDVPGQLFHVAGADSLPDAGLTDPEGETFDPFSGGLHIPARTRVELEVRARDNFAVLETSRAEADRDAFTTPADPDAGPLHARFDLNRPEAQRPEFQAPFLPMVGRAELLAEPERPGVAWWIESVTRGDRYAGIDFLTDFVYSRSDEEEVSDLVAAGDPSPAYPLRWLQIRAQDAHGNVSRAKLPLFVGGATFDARTMGLETQRVRPRAP